MIRSQSCFRSAQKCSNSPQCKIALYSHTGIHCKKILKPYKNWNFNQHLSNHENNSISNNDESSNVSNPVLLLSNKSNNPTKLSKNSSEKEVSL